MIIAAMLAGQVAAVGGDGLPRAPMRGAVVMEAGMVGVAEAAVRCGLRSRSWADRVQRGVIRGQALFLDQMAEEQGITSDEALEHALGAIDFARFAGAAEVRRYGKQACARLVPAVLAPADRLSEDGRQ